MKIEAVFSVHLEGFHVADRFPIVIQKRASGHWPGEHGRRPTIIIESTLADVLKVTLDNHYSRIDYARHTPKLNQGGHPYCPPRLMPTINGGKHFLFTEAGTFARLGKSIYGGGRLKTTASKNNLFLEAVVLRCPPP
jgi:hypothetical protein